MPPPLYPRLGDSGNRLSAPASPSPAPAVRSEQGPLLAGGWITHHSGSRCLQGTVWHPQTVPATAAAYHMVEKCIRGRDANDVLIKATSWVMHPSTASGGTVAHTFMRILTSYMSIYCTTEPSVFEQRYWPLYSTANATTTIESDSQSRPIWDWQISPETMLTSMSRCWPGWPSLLKSVDKAGLSFSHAIYSWRDSGIVIQPPCPRNGPWDRPGW